MDIALIVIWSLSLYLWLCCAPLCAAWSARRGGPIWFAGLIGLALGPFGVYLVRAGVERR